MRVVYLFPEELPMRAARGIQAVNTVWALSEREEVLFIPAAFSPESKRFYALQRKGPQIIPLARHLGPFKSQLIFVLRAFPFLKKADVLFTRHLKTAWWLLKFRSLHQKPLVYEVHEIFAEKKKEITRLEEEVFQNVDGLVTVSRGLKEEILKRVRVAGKITSIPNGTRINSLSEDKLLAEVKEIFYIGSARYFWKGTSLLFDVARLLPSEVKIIIVGEGDSQRISSISRIKFLGFQTPADTYRILKRVSLAILPNSRKNRQSSYYTCPLKLLDYMAAGCAIVASDLPSVREIVTPKEALLVTPDDAKALAEGIKKLVADRHLRLSLAREAYRKAKEFSWEKRAIRLCEFLREVAF